MLPLSDLGSKRYLWYKSSKMRIAEPTFRWLTGYFQYACQEAIAEIYIRQGFQG